MVRLGLLHSAVSDVLVTIDALDDEGSGVGHADGRELHLPNALPGETVRARVLHASPHRGVDWGVCVEQVSPPSPLRVAPACPAFGQCGGCALQHLAYPAQLDEKRARVARALASAGIRVPPVPVTIGSERLLGYRNRSKLVLAPGPAGTIRWGSFAPASHHLVDMAGCRVPEAPMDELAAEVIRAAEAAGLCAYDERDRSGELRHLVLRRTDTGRLLITIVAKDAAALPALRSIAESLCAARAEVAGVVAHLHARPGGAIFGADGVDVLLAGASEVEERVGGVRLMLSARSFFQVNRAQAARLYAAAAAAAGSSRVVDLYSGAGGIALTCALGGATVVGVESLPAAVADAERSARASGLADTARFLVGDAADGLPRAAALLGGVDAVVVDPPRKGLAPAARTAVLALAPPRLVYASCDPSSLARDLVALTAGGYRLTSLAPYDLFPGTPHVETLALLERA